MVVGHIAADTFYTQSAQLLHESGNGVVGDLAFLGIDHVEQGLVRCSILDHLLRFVLCLCHITGVGIAVHAKGNLLPVHGLGVAVELSVEIGAAGAARDHQRYFGLQRIEINVALPLGDVDDGLLLNDVRVVGGFLCLGGGVILPEDHGFVHALLERGQLLLARMGGLVRVVGVDIGTIEADDGDEVSAAGPEAIVAIVHRADSQSAILDGGGQGGYVAGAQEILERRREVAEAEFHELALGTIIIGAIAVFERQGTELHRRQLGINPLGADHGHGGRAAAGIADGLAAGVGAVLLVLPTGIPLDIVHTLIDDLVHGLGGFLDGGTFDQGTPRLGAADTIRFQALGFLVGGDGLLGLGAVDAVHYQTAEQDLNCTGCGTGPVLTGGAGRGFIGDLSPGQRTNDAVRGQAIPTLPSADSRNHRGRKNAVRFLTGGKTNEVLRDLDQIASMLMLNRIQHLPVPPFLRDRGRPLPRPRQACRFRSG